MTNDIYEVWDLESGNVLTAFSTEQEALELVRVNVREHGAEAVRRWMLMRERRGRSTLLGEGDALISRALALLPLEARTA